MPEVDVEILHETQSLCPVCLRRLDARYVRRGQSILLERTCPEHGTFAVDIWHERTEEDVTPPRFDGWSRPKTPSYPREPRTAVRHGCPYDCGLCPAHAQHTCTGLVEVTLRCNMACPICYAAAGGAVPDDPSPETVAFQLDSLRRASPGCNVQLSGGEPTVRDDLPAIIRMARERGFGLLQVNSNGLRLGLEAGYARTLREAGLDSVYLQWDSPDLEGCLPLRGTVALPDGLDLLAVKRRAVEQCTAAGLGVVLVATVARGVNDDRLGALLRLALELGPGVRGLHIQPVARFGRYPGRLEDGLRFTLSDVMAALCRQVPQWLCMEHFHPPGCEHSLCSFSSLYAREKAADGSPSLRWLPDAARSCCGPAVDKVPVPAAEGARKSRQFVASHWRGDDSPRDGGKAADGSPSLRWLPDAARSCCGPAVDKVPVPAAEGARKSRQFVASHWRGDDSPRDGGKAALADDFGRFLARAGAEQRFTLSCMAFQDALSLDVERVRGCCIHVVRPDGRMIPFCLHNLTSTEGRMLYPQRLACGEEGHDGI